MSETGQSGRVSPLLFENVRQAFGVIRSHRLRSALLIIGVAIGITAILAVVTILIGLGKQIERDMAGADRPFLMVTRFDMMTEGPGQEDVLRRKEIDEGAVAAIRRTCDAVSWIDYRHDPDGRLRVVQRGGEHSQPLKIIGATPAFPHIHSIAVENGRFL
jgi:putative ABC transport system permease protein